MTGFFPEIQLALRLRAFKQWVVACGLGMMAYFLINTILVPVLTQGQRTDSLIFDVFVVWHRGGWTVAEIGLVGLCQWWVLRQYYAEAWRWLAITALCSAITLLISHSFIQYYPSLFPLIMGLCLGSVQWLFFRKSRQSAYWIAAVVITHVVTHIIFYVMAAPFELLPVEPVSISAAEAMLAIALELLRYGLACLAQGLFTGIVLARVIASDKRRLAR